jgi:hypothetical protein
MTLLYPTNKIEEEVVHACMDKQVSRERPQEEYSRDAA